MKNITTLLKKVYKAANKKCKNLMFTMLYLKKNTWRL